MKEALTCLDMLVDDLQDTKIASEFRQIADALWSEYREANWPKKSAPEGQKTQEDEDVVEEEAEEQSESQDKLSFYTPSLRSKLIRLAYDSPELRSYILPLVGKGEKK